MSALLVLLLLAQAAEAPQAPLRRLETDLSFAYGYGSRMSFGATGAVALSWPVCGRSLIECRVRTGVLLGYQNEPYARTAPFFAPSAVTGSNHRAELFATLGFTAAFFRSRRVLVEVELFAGWTGLWVQGSVRNEAVALSRSFFTRAHELTFGFNYALGLRLTDHVSIVSKFVLPIPYAGVAISSYFMATLGPRVTF